MYLPFIAIFPMLLFQYSHEFPQGDDFIFFMAGGSPAKIWSSYKLYYSVSGSRLGNLLAQIFLLWDLKVWKIVTPFVITAIALLLFYYATGRFGPAVRSDSSVAWNDFGLAAVCAVFPGLMPVSDNLYGDTFLWLDGSCNYLYPFFFMLVGFIPIYNAMRERRTPAFFLFASPPCFLAAGLLHEQMAMLLFAMCTAAFLYLRKSKRLTRYLVSLCIISLLIFIFTFTCPGAYRRFNMTTASAGRSRIGHIILQNVPTYLNAVFTTTKYFWIALLGVCALYLLRGKTDWVHRLLSVSLAAGIVLSGILALLPFMEQSPAVSGSGPAAVAFCLRALYLLACLFAVLIAARENGRYRYVAVLFAGMWASQGIPMLLGSVGRPLLPLIMMIFLTAISLPGGVGHRCFNALKWTGAAAGICLLMVADQFSARNYNAYQDILRQVSAVKQGKSDTVVIDYRKFNNKYFYFNAFNQGYYAHEMKEYYKLPANTKMKMIG